MAKTLPLVAFAVLLLAGCSSPPSEPDGGVPASTQPPVTTVVGARQGPVYTDTLHLLDRPALTPAVPRDGDPLRIPVEPFASQFASARFDDGWDWSWQDGQVGLVGTWTLWVEVVGDVVNDPSPLAGVDCFWSFAIVVGSYDTGDFHGLDCVPEPTNVPPGIRELTIPFDLPGLVIDPGMPVHFEMHVQDLSRGPGAEVNVLTGSAQHDSRLAISGLAIELPPSLLMQGPP